MKMSLTSKITTFFAVRAIMSVAALAFTLVLSSSLMAAEIKLESGLYDATSHDGIGCDAKIINLQDGSILMVFQSTPRADCDDAGVQVNFKHSATENTYQAQGNNSNRPRRLTVLNSTNFNFCWDQCNASQTVFYSKHVDNQ